MTQTAVATEVHQTLDVHVDFATQVTFGGDLRDFVTQLIDLLVAQVLAAGFTPVAAQML